MDARIASCTGEHINKSGRKKEEEQLYLSVENISSVTELHMHELKKGNVQRKNKPLFKLSIRLCKANGKHIMKNKTQRTTAASLCGVVSLDLKLKII